MTTGTHHLHPPASDEAAEYYFTYIRLVPAGDLLELAARQVSDVQDLLRGVTESESLRLHAPYTWTLRQVVGHLIDAERIFADRLHKFACGDLQPLPGMDQDLYVKNCDYQRPTLPALVEEWALCRRANVLLLTRLTDEAWDRRGVASGHSVTVRALAFMLVGHVTYHLRIIRQRLQADSDQPAAAT